MMSAWKWMSVWLATWGLAAADTHFVSPAGSNTAPYTSLATAAHVIQDAVNASVAGDVIEVAPGIYQTGSVVIADGAATRVNVDRAITVRGVAGPEQTIIDGLGAVRGVYLASGAVLEGITVRNGITPGNLFTDGAGILSLGIVSNCVVTGCFQDFGFNGGAISGGTVYDSDVYDNVGYAGGGMGKLTAHRCRIYNNSARFTGGGCFFSTLYHCQIFGNTAGSNGGGVFLGHLYHCTVVGNTASVRGGGVFNTMEVFNSVVYFNTALVEGPNHFVGGDIRHTCITPLPTGQGNIARDPLLLSLNAPFLTEGSPCIDAGSDALSFGAEDFDGDPRRTGFAVDMGADEFADQLTGPISLQVNVKGTQVVVDTPFQLEAEITGKVRKIRWTIGDEIFGPVGTISPSFASPGPVTIKVEAINDSMVVSTNVLIDVLATYTNFVDVAGSNIPPYTNATQAATNIQAAVDVAAIGGTVLIASGTYASGGSRLAAGQQTRVVVDRPLRLLGGAQTADEVVIQGETRGTMMGMRGVFLGAGARLENLTVANSELPMYLTVIGNDQDGGGVFCETGAVVDGCVVRECHAGFHGGGVFGGLIKNSVILNCSADNEGGGVSFSVVEDSEIRGCSGQTGAGANSSNLTRCRVVDNVGNGSGLGVGLAFSTARDCIITGNRGFPGSGGGARVCTMFNCLIADNHVQGSSGGILGGTAINCTIVGNSAGEHSGGASSADIQNSIVYFNTAPSDANSRSTTFTHSCTTPAPLGSGNTALDPQLVNVVSNDFRLLPTSPCINTGQNQNWMVGASDLDGHSRIIDGTVDMGVVELVFDADFRVFLEGPYQTATHEMANMLETQSLLPLTSPYAADPIQVSALPTNVTDWVLVELRSAPDAAPFFSRSAVVLQNGQVVAPEAGASGLVLEAGPGAHYLAIKHRNHLAVRSANMLDFTQRTVAHDFTDGDAVNNLVQVEPGIFALRGGDVDGDGVVGSVDQLIYDTQQSLSGYRRADISLSGTVNSTDRNTFIGPNLGQASTMFFPETPLKPALRVAPDRRTVESGEQLVLQGMDSSQLIHWAFVENNSGGMLHASNGTSITYQAGGSDGVVDVVEAWDQDNLLGRTFLNVISPGEVASLGKAVIVSGGKALDDPVWEVTENMSTKAYNTLRYRGYSRDNILYHSFGTARDVDGDGLMNDIDQTIATKADIQRIFTTDLGTADRLFIYFADHGSEVSGSGFFRLNTGETISALELDTWISDWQDTYNKPVTVVLEFCYSGATIAQLAYAGPAERIVIATAGANELAFFMSKGRVSFSEHFFNGVLIGNDVKTSFENAREAMVQSSRGNQTAIISDANAAAGQFLGATFIAGKDFPIIGSVLDEQVLTDTQSVLLFSDNISSVYDLERVWVSITQPNYAIDANTGVPVIDQIERDLLLNPVTGRYELQFEGFNQQGTYLLNFFAQDIWGSVSPPRSSAVIQQGFVEKLILVAGAPSPDASEEAIRKTCRKIFTTFESRLFDGSTIQYLGQSANEDLNGDFFNDVDAVASGASLQAAIQSFATDADKLTVYFVGGATANRFHLTGSELLLPNVLANLLDFYQNGDRDLQVLLDFSGAGEYLDQLAPPAERRRVSVASSDRDRRSVMTTDLSFSSLLMSNIFNGDTLGAALTDTRKGIRRASGNLRQKVLLNDNANAIPNEKNLDSLLADTIFIGNAFVTGDDIPSIGSVNSPTELEGTSTLTLFAEDVTDVDGVSEVWVEVTTPTNSIGQVVVTNFLTAVSGTRWEVLKTDFEEPGMYHLSFFARDNTGEISEGRQTSVIQTDTNLFTLSAANLPDLFEPDNVSSNAVLADIPAVQYHTFHTADDCDWVRFFALADTVYDIETVHLDDQIDSIIEVYQEQGDGSLILIDRVDEFGRDEGELTGLDFPETGFYQVRVCQAPDAEYQPGGYFLVIYVPAGFQGVNIVAWDVIAGAPISGASVSLSGFGGGTTDGSGVVRYPAAGRGNYTASVAAPGGNQYVPLFGTRNASETSSNARSAYGNARNLGASSFASVAYNSIALADSAYMVFGFVPVSYVAGSVRQETYGLPVENAFIGFFRNSDNALFRAYPWASYGSPWLTGSSGTLPGDTILLPNTSYRMEIRAPGYPAIIQNITTPGRGQTLNLGELTALIQTSGNSIPDAWELFYNFPTDIDDNADGDLDGMGAYAEFIAGTSPVSMSSFFAASEQVINHDGSVTVRWLGQEHRRYRVLRTDTLVPLPQWGEVHAVGPVATEGAMEYTHPANQAGGEGYFRVDVQFP